MRKNLIILSLLFVGMFTACAQSKKATKSKVKTSTAKSKVNISSVSMRRSACYGTCPEYSITINSSGMAEYNGGRNAEPQGVYKKNIGLEAAQKLLKECTDYRVDTCASIYKIRIADVPGFHFIFTINGQEKRVFNAQEGPLYFVSLSEEMDRLGTPDSSWKKAPEAKK